MNKEYIRVERLIHWKTIYDQIVSDKDFRRDFLKDEQHGDVTIKALSRPLKNYPVKGTICIKAAGGEDHFLSYKKVDANTLNIFDPTPAGGPYGDLYPKSEKHIKRVFGVSKILKHRKHPQICPGDTFCQTWSLFWNMANSQKVISKFNGSNSPMSRAMSKRIMYDFVKKIVNSSEFLRHAKPYLQHPFSKLSTFIYYSRRINKQNIDEIMDAEDNPPTPSPKPSIAFRSVSLLKSRSI